MSSPVRERSRARVGDQHLFPLAVGVVGHRDLVTDDGPALTDATKSFLGEMQHRVPHARIELLSGLASGADLLVAEAALALGVRVRAVLPMPWEMYRDDFDPADRARVERLLSADDVDVWSLRAPPGIDRERAATPGPERDRFYVGLMNHLVGRSHVLLALWDGQATGLPGGTGDAVLRFLSRGVELRGAGAVEMSTDDAATPAIADVVAWLPVRRDVTDPVPTPSVQYLSTGADARIPVVSGDVPEWYQARLAALETHLVDAAAQDERDGPPTPTLMASIEGIDADAAAELGPIATEFDRADGLAMFHQRRSNLVFKLMALAAGSMGLFFLLYAKVDALEIYLVAYLVLAVAGYIVFAIARRRDWFTRHLTDRVVAESLRVRFYLALSGIEEEVEADRLLDLTGIAGLRGFAWVRDALRVGSAPPRSDGSVDADTVATLRRAWIDDQAAYFRARLVALHHRQEQLERVRAALFALSFAAGVALLFFSKSMGKVELSSNVDLKTAVLVLMGLLPLWLGIWELYQNKMATRELIWQYRNQAEHFTSASRALATASSAAEQRRIVADLGNRALFEVYLWSLHRFHREYEPSLPG